jgi:hypothetical protein
MNEALVSCKNGQTKRKGYVVLYKSFVDHKPPPHVRDERTAVVACLFLYKRKLQKKMMGGAPKRADHIVEWMKNWSAGDKDMYSLTFELCLGK